MVLLSRTSTCPTSYGDAMTDPLRAKFDGPIHLMFGLSYANYFIMQRSVLQAMPIPWQEKFVALMRELEETVDLDKIPQSFQVEACNPNSAAVEDDQEPELITDPYRDYRHPLLIPTRR